MSAIVSGSCFGLRAPLAPRGTRSAGLHGSGCQPLRKCGLRRIAAAEPLPAPLPPLRRRQGGAPPPRAVAAPGAGKQEHGAKLDALFGRSHSLKRTTWYALALAIFFWWRGEIVSCAAMVVGILGALIMGLDP